jgi:2,3-dihydroxybenzoate decarboxylase
LQLPEPQFETFAQTVRISARIRAGEHFTTADLSAYRNIVVTTTGVCAHPALLCALSALGEDSVMFSVDYTL